MCVNSYLARVYNKNEIAHDLPHAHIFFWIFLKFQFALRCKKRSGSKRRRARMAFLMNNFSFNSSIQKWLNGKHASRIKDKECWRYRSYFISLLWFLSQRQPQKDACLCSLSSAKETIFFSSFCCCVIRNLALNNELFSSNSFVFSALLF